MKKSIIILLILGFVLFSGCKEEEKNKIMAIDPQNMDLTIKPGTNFYQYANGGWMKRNPLPADKGRYGTFDELQESNNKIIRKLILDLSSSENQEGSIAQKIGDFYASGMDTLKIEKQGLSPLYEYFDQINSIQSKDEIEEAITTMHKYGIYPLFILFGGVDAKNSKMFIPQIYQGGMGMSDRDYYLNDDPRSKEIRAAYRVHLKKMFELLGDKENQAEKHANTIMDMEIRLAKASNTRLENRDPEKTYNKVNLKSLSLLVPEFKWKTYFDGIGLPDPGDMNIYQPAFMEEVNKMFKTIPVEDWKTYLRWNLINATANYLNDDFVNEDFNFYGKVVRGTEVNEPRWKRVINATNNALGEAVGQMFVKEYFPPEAKERMVHLVENLEVSLGNRINNLDWMSDQTKANALEKLAAIRVKVGYPDKWRSYDKLKVENKAYVLNVLTANKFNFEYMKNKMNKPVDPNDWGMTPQTVNAYYSPTRNEIVFPAGILQPPFFYKDADDAVNYGAIGVVIGHEMTHGFDDQGRQYDKDGNLKDWWTEEDARKFKERTEVLVKQFDAFIVLDTVHANGKLTLGENIADLGGLNISFDAFKSATKGLELSDIDGFTAEQRFYLAYAHVWAQNIRDKEILRRTKEDPHSLGKFRVNGPLPNLMTFHAAFNIKQGDPMFLPVEKMAKIW